eukprot:TRINITY_DN15725_c0_g1_i1.p1 TRINITY_DN15725_c0_g1~~TRINITY_DN15725_c0_g1_i1.p1  ORF type:complete len:394 (+),score=46.01 TRINITY_DN15725_c0_g1_i1:497-1678(+)
MAGGGVAAASDGARPHRSWDQIRSFQQKYLQRIGLTFTALQNPDSFAVLSQHLHPSLPPADPSPPDDPSIPTDGPPKRLRGPDMQAVDRILLSHPGLSSREHSRLISTALGVPYGYASVQTRTRRLHRAWRLVTRNPTASVDDLAARLKDLLRAYYDYAPLVFRWRTEFVRCRSAPFQADDRLKTAGQGKAKRLLDADVLVERPSKRRQALGASKHPPQTRSERRLFRAKGRSERRAGGVSRHSVARTFTLYRDGCRALRRRVEDLILRHPTSGDREIRQQVATETGRPCSHQTVRIVRDRLIAAWRYVVTHRRTPLARLVARVGALLRVSEDRSDLVRLWLVNYGRCTSCPIGKAKEEDTDLPYEVPVPPDPVGPATRTVNVWEFPESSARY